MKLAPHNSRFLIGPPLLAIFVAVCLTVAPIKRAPLAAAAAADAPRQPVLVELFTSEGCSSCPPADALLARLDEAQFVPGARAIVLSEHVTYWNYLGWNDPFSQDAMSERQQRYAGHFGLSSVYTPQAVIDGAAEALGSDPSAISRAVAKAAAAPKPELLIQNAALQGDGVRFAVSNPHEVRGMLMAALAKDATVSRVARGENAGRALRHVAVVRVLKEVAPSAPKSGDFWLQMPAKTAAKLQDGPLRLVVFVADRSSGQVLAIAQQTVGN